MMNNIGSASTSSSSSSSSSSYKTPLIEPVCIVWNEVSSAAAASAEDQLATDAADGWVSTVEAIVNNRHLTEREKCFLCLAVTERHLYKRDLCTETVELVFETQEDSLQSGRFLCSVRKKKKTPDVDDIEEEQQQQKKKKKKLSKLLGQVGLAIIGPTVGAVVAVWFRVCCCGGATGAC